MKQVLFIALCVIGMVAQSAAQEESDLVREVFDTVMPELREKTHVPLKLPTYLGIVEHDLGTFPLYAIVEEVTPSRYFLQIAFSSDCSGGTACRWGGATGERIGTKTRPPAGKPIRLSRGITGYFVDSTCGANCSDSVLTWDQAGYRYTVESKAAASDFLRKVANSAIAYTAPTYDAEEATCFVEVYTGPQSTTLAGSHAWAVNVATKQVFNSGSRDGLPVLVRLPRGKYEITAFKPGSELTIEKDVECSAKLRELSIDVPLSRDVPNTNSELRDEVFSSVEEFVKAKVKSADELVSAKGDLNGDGIEDWVGWVLRRGADFFYTDRLYVLIRQGTTGPFRVEVTNGERQAAHNGCCWVENIQIKNSSLYIQYNSKTHGTMEAATHQFKLYKGAWRLVGVRVFFLDIGSDTSVDTDTNVLTGKVVVMRHKGEKRTGITTLRKKFSASYLMDYDYDKTFGVRAP